LEIKPKIMKFSKSIALVVTLLCTVLFSSCDENNPLNPTGNARLKVINSIATHGSVLLQFDSVTFNPTFTYTEATDYRSLVSGTHIVRVVGTSGSTTTEAALGRTLDANTTHTWFVHDNINLDGFVFTTALDNLNSPASGKFKLRVANVSPRTGAINIKATASPSNMFSNVSMSSVSGYAEFDEGTYSLEIRDATNGNLYGTPQTVTFTNGRIYDLAVSGLNTLGSPIIFTVYLSN
jgi:hypothetical protein